MRMKVSLALGPRRPLSRQTAWGCLTTNLVMPGAGSLAAGRVSGYAQLALAIAGTAVTILFGVHFIWWFLSNWSRLHNPDVDPVETMGEILRAVKWPALGIGLFFVAWLWALATSLGIVVGARKHESKNVPPRLG